jgi:transcriptional regulator with GAF, ATPase, and Fis domain
MGLPSQKYSFDNRLLAVEELFAQIRLHGFERARKGLAELDPADFEGRPHELGVYFTLEADAAFQESNYPRALEFGLKAAKTLAGLPLNSRYGRALVILAKVYMILGDLKNAEMRGRDSLASYRRGADAEGQVNAMNMLSWIAFVRGEYERSLGYLEDARRLVPDDPGRTAQLNGNLGRVAIFVGRWTEAEQYLTEALDYSSEQGYEAAEASARLSLGYLYFRRRHFAEASRQYRQAQSIIERLGLKREKVIYLEYTGELALEKGDYFRAKSLLTEAYHQGRLLAAGSSMVGQAARRLAEADLALDNADEAMKHAQKALEVSQQMGERAEVAASARVVARIFADREEFGEAREYARQAVELFREVGDQMELARSLVVLAEIKVAAGEEAYEKTRLTFDDAARLFKKLKLDYWLGEVEFRSGVFACQQRDLSGGFKRLSRAEKLFSLVGDKVKLRAVHQFLQSLSEQAVALSISEENEFKIFGNALSGREAKGVRSGRMAETFNVLLARTGGSRALIYCPDMEKTPVLASFDFAPQRATAFAEGFKQLLGQEIAIGKPTLLLDCRRDPYVSSLFPDEARVVASIIVVPLHLGECENGYLYIDKSSSDNMLNPFTQAELNFAVGFSDVIAFRASEQQKAVLIEDNRRLRAQLQKEAVFPNIITRNQRMLEMLAQVRQVVDSSISIMIEGETGSGKDLLARTIHYNSNRREKRFITVNCAALPESLLESELFGYKRGAFTGADHDKAGLFEEADGGTFFLDEITDMPLNIQAKILRVLEEKELIRLGETAPRKVDVRIISATNKNLRQELEARRFRQDLYYRLTALTFRLPPLRERKEDISLLVDHFLQDTDKRVLPETMKHLVVYDWPGNVRELDNEIKKLVLLAGAAREIKPSILSSRLRASRSEDRDGGNGSAVDADGDPLFTEQYSLYDYLATHERRFIVKALKERQGVKKHAAALLSIPESTLRLKIKQYSIDPNDPDHTVH